MGLSPDALVKENVVYYPAMVLPVEGKQGFVCPPQHIVKLEKFLADCKAYLFVGCSGSDEDLFDLLTKHAAQAFVGGLATGNTDHDAVLGRFKARIPAVISAPLSAERYVFSGGFTKFLEQKLDGFQADLKQYLGR